jgi:hypothetical protein
MEWNRMGTNRDIITKRKIKLDRITELISQGYKPKEIMQTLEISRNQYYRDLHEIKKELFDPQRIKENVVNLFLQREYLIKKTMEDYLSSVEPPARAVFVRILRDLINDKEKSYDRMGLLDLNKVTEDNTISDLIERTIESLKKYSIPNKEAVKETIENITPINKNKVTDYDIEMSMIRNKLEKNRKEDD